MSATVYYHSMCSDQHVAVIQQDQQGDDLYFKKMLIHLILCIINIKQFRMQLNFLIQSFSFLKLHWKFEGWIQIHLIRIWKDSDAGFTFCKMISNLNQAPAFASPVLYSVMRYITSGVLVLLYGIVKSNLYNTWEAEA